MAIDKTSLFQIIDNYKSEMTSFSDDIFDHPELGNQEYRSSSLLIERLERAGFQIEKNMFNGLDLKVRKNLSGFIVYVLAYSFLLQPASILGYIDELLKTKKKWGTK